MVKYSTGDHRKEAMLYEKKARECNVKEGGLRYRPMTSEYFERSADEWLKEAKALDYHGDKGTVLGHADFNYKTAIRYLSGEDKHRKNEIENKREKVRDMEKALKVEQNIGTRTFLPVLSVSFFVLALAFSSFSITGFVIDETTNSTSSYIALVCFGIGIILGLAYIRRMYKIQKGEDKSKKSSKKAKSKKR